MAKITLYEFDGSTYVRTVRMLLAEKGADYEQEPVHVLKGEPRQPEYLARHPLAKYRLLTLTGSASLRQARSRHTWTKYCLAGLLRRTIRRTARMRMAMGIIDSYGHSALIGVAGYHLFADFIGGLNESARQGAIATSRLVRIQNSQAADQPRSTGRFADSLLTLGGQASIRQWSGAVG